MKISHLLFAGAIAIAASSCNNNSPKTLDACTCATIIDQNSDDYKKCQESRADAKFESDYQKCKLASVSGISDTSKVTLQKGNVGAALKQVEAGTYTIDPATSTIGWIGEKITGQKNNGNIQVKSGSFVLENGVLKGGELILDMNSITVENLSGKSKTDLETHLKSDDFFGVAKHNQAKYVIKSATVKDNIQYDIIGDLTVKGITKELNTKLVIAPNGTGATVAGAIAFDRTAFDVRYRSGKFFDNLGDDLIKDEVILKVMLKAKKS